jgi:hypothetical protein
MQILVFYHGCTEAIPKVTQGLNQQLYSSAFIIGLAGCSCRQQRLAASRLGQGHR